MVWGKPAAEAAAGVGAASGPWQQVASIISPSSGMLGDEWRDTGADDEMGRACTSTSLKTTSLLRESTEVKDSTEEADEVRLMSRPSSSSEATKEPLL